MWKTGANPTNRGTCLFKHKYIHPDRIMIYLLIFKQLSIYTFRTGFSASHKTNPVSYWAKSVSKKAANRRLPLSPGSPGKPLIHVFDTLDALLGFVLQGCTVPSPAKSPFFPPTISLACALSCSRCSPEDYARVHGIYLIVFN